MQNMRLLTLLPTIALIVSAELLAARATATDALWGSNALTKVMRSDEPPVGEPAPVRIEGARGEIASGQAVYRSSEERSGVRATITDFRQRQTNETIAATVVQLQWVRYIDVTRNSEGVPADELVAQAPASIPDPYWEESEIPVAGGQAQPLWIEVRVPRDAKAGVYDAELTVGDASDSVALPVTLRVWDFEMPVQRHLSVVNWWNFPGLGFSDRVKAGTPEYYALLDRFCRFLVDHRQTDINTSISLVRELGSEQQGYTHDTSPLERYAETAFNAGIRQIHLHSMAGKTEQILDPMGQVAPDEGAFRRLSRLGARDPTTRLAETVCGQHHRRALPTP